VKRVSEVKYEAEDGRKFSTPEECEQYEVLLYDLDAIMKPFGKHPDKTDFTNGGGYLQHKKSDVERAKKRLIVTGSTYLQLEDPVGFNVLGRYFDDSGVSCLYKAWLRLACMDALYREWGQPYYANHPDKGVQKPYVI
jgi:hypothetical protein